MTTPLLRMTGISKAFNGVPALARAELAVDRGEVHAIVGQNGAGKSTLIKILTGVYQRDEGEIAFDGAPSTIASPREAQERGVSTIYQELNLVPLRSVTENVVLGYEPRTRWGTIDWRGAHRRTGEILSRFGVDIDVKAPLATYPTAIQQLVAIARAVSLNAKLVIMDEPTSSLDEREVEVLFGVIRELKNSGTSILYVSHFLDELFEICDRVTIMRDGRTVGVANIAETTKLDLIAAMLGRSAAEIQTAGMTELAATGDRSGELLLEAEGVATNRRLRNLSLKVRRGEIVGLAGLLGSGRTEAARAIFGCDKPTAGRVAMKGTAIDCPRTAISRGIGYLTEDRKAEGIVPELSVRENMTLALLPQLSRMGLVDKAREREIVERFIRSLGIKAAHMDQKVSELSGGNQQKVLLGRWLAIQPALLILDEPTRGVDVGAKLEIQAIIRRYVDEGCGVILISSEFQELIEGADEIVVLQEGESVRTVSNPGVTEDMLVHAIAQPKAKEVDA
ncbi:sugar ABC transporter ATP-binding protein [Chelativorans sp.]|uniref:sugar ABC transporter ATP-binding protein n=1 Tax=Chelativorans sp. TaxID=2203393 RepID=UPI002811689E|nr:sugar ABC transporter ATP-binding protein [Chelativorans sp.]